MVIVGAGFGGLEAAFRLAGAPVEITLIDRRNHHLFQPLLYQVATASLATSEIAWPIRYLLRDRHEVTTLFANVSGVDAADKRVLLDDGDALPYDTLVLATGARHAYFGHDEWEPFAPGLKTLEDATTLRRRILRRLRARRARDRSGAARGAADLRHRRRRPDRRRNGRHHRRPGAATRCRRDFRNIDTRKARVVLIEAGPRVLAGFPDDLSAYAQRSLEEHRRRGGAGTAGHRMHAPMASSMAASGWTPRTIIWAAGVRASRAAEWLDAPADRADRLQVEPDLTVPGHPDIFADRRYRDDRRP